ncbi:hypothetical protein EAE99_009185 [Botrytis elliptica]|nr:hypothetical protein EAE99_009185 [Botrytis elliptica]
MEGTAGGLSINPIKPQGSPSQQSSQKPSKNGKRASRKKALSKELVDKDDDGENEDEELDELLDPATPEKDSIRHGPKGKGRSGSSSASADETGSGHAAASSRFTTPTASQSTTPTPSAAKKRGRPVTRLPSTPKKAINKAATLKERRHAYDNNPEGVSVIGNFQTLLDNFTEKKDAGFGDLRQLPKSHAYRNVILWKHLRSLSDHEWACIQEDIWPTTEATKVNYPAFGYHCWIRALYWIIKSGHAGFQAVKQNDEYIRGITVENWNRALTFLRVWIEMPNKNVGTETDRKKPDFPAIIPEYLTAEGMSQLKVNQDELDENEPCEMKSCELFEAEMLRRDMEYSHSGASNKPITYEEFVSQVSMLRGPGTVAGNRPAITREQAEQFLLAMKDKCKVIHDGFRSMSEHGARVQSDVIKNAMETDNVAKSIERPAHIKEDSFYKSLEEVEAFWAKMKNVSTISVETPTFNEACKLRGMDPTTRTKEGLKFSYHHMQVADIAWMAIQEDSPIRGGIVANECGLGKTLEIYGLIHEQSLTAIKQHRESGPQVGVEKKKYKPTLVLVPSAVIGVHVKESDLFQSELQVYLYYGSESTVPYNRKDRLIQRNTSKGKNGLQAFLQNLDFNDPETTRVVILSTYTTFASRTESVRELDPEGAVVRELSEAEVNLWFKNLKKKEEDEGVEEAETDDQNFIDDADVAENPDVVEGSTTEEKEKSDSKAQVKLSHPDNSFEIFSQVENLFHRIFLDEGHAAKNSKTHIHQAVLMVNAYCHWMVSATPMMNKIDDLHGILNLLWRGEWALNSSYDEVASYEDDFDASTMLDRDSPSYNDVLRLRLWTLDPLVFKRICAKTFDGDRTRLVLRAILGKIQLRRTMLTEIEVEGEPTVKIRDQIPPLTTRVVELDPDEDFESWYDDFYQSNIDKLIGAKKQKKEKQGKRLEDGQGSKTAADEGAMNLKIHRNLCHGTFTPLLSILMEKLEKSSVEQVNEWFTFKNDKGASFFHRMTRHNYFDPLPMTRLPLAFYMAAMCPKIKWIGGYLAEHTLGEKKDRVLVIGDWPMPLWLMECYFSLLGFNVLSIRSEMSMNERQAAADKFNDPNHPCEVMFVGSRLGALGLNFQKGCHRVIIAEQSNQAGQDFQAAGRVGRLGQEHQQDIVQLYLHHSYDSRLLLRKIKKFEEQVAGEGLMDKTSPLSFDEQRENIIRDVFGLRLKVLSFEGKDYYAWDDIEQDEPTSSTGYVYKLSPIAEAKKLKRQGIKDDGNEDGKQLVLENSDDDDKDSIMGDDDTDGKDSAPEVETLGDKSNSPEIDSGSREMRVDVSGNDEVGDRAPSEDADVMRVDRQDDTGIPSTPQVEQTQPRKRKRGIH